MKKGVVITASVLILLAIILGAFTAHALKEILRVKQLVSFETGVRYQMYMGIALMILGFNYHRFRKKNFKLFYYLILSGTLLFSFSIYTLIFADHMGWMTIKKIMGPITPLGGTLMISGWTVFIVQFVKQKEEYK